jgi:CRP-like cAMP-binding protein
MNPLVRGQPCRARGRGRHAGRRGRARLHVLVLAEGTAAVASNGEAVASLGPGDFFGEVAILGAGRRTASVTSTSPVRLLAMFGTEFRQLEAAHPEIASRLGQAMRARFVGASAA